MKKLKKTNMNQQYFPWGKKLQLTLNKKIAVFAKEQKAI